MIFRHLEFSLNLPALRKFQLQPTHSRKLKNICQQRQPLSTNSKSIQAAEAEFYLDCSSTCSARMTQSLTVATLECTSGNILLKSATNSFLFGSPTGSASIQR